MRLSKIALAAAALAALMTATPLCASSLGPLQCHGTRQLRGAHDKRAIAAAQGIADFWNFELDHTIPLCLTSQDDESNLQLQPWPLAIRKDRDEQRLCAAACAGIITQQQAAGELRRLWPAGEQFQLGEGQ